MNIKLPKDIQIQDLELTLIQDEDNCGRTDFDFQELKVKFPDGGGGHYYVLQTDRWAMDQEDHALFECLDNICTELDKEEK